MQSVRYAEQIKDILSVHFGSDSVYRSVQVPVGVMAPAASFGYGLDRVRRRAPAFFGRLEAVA